MSDSSIIIGSLYRIADTLGVFVKPLVEALKEESMGTMSRVQGYGNAAMGHVRNKVRQHKDKHTKGHVKSHKDHTKPHKDHTKPHHNTPHKGGYRKKRTKTVKRGGKLNRKTRRNYRKSISKRKQ